MEDADWERLKVAATAARDHAYAPYSGFAVGAAVLTDAGNLYAGANVENASYGATICAERVALAAAVTAGERDFRALAIVTSALTPTPPCGICRQWIIELAPRARVRSFNDTTYVEYAASELLPHAFGPGDLE